MPSWCSIDWSITGPLCDPTQLICIGDKQVFASHTQQDGSCSKWAPDEDMVHMGLAGTAAAHTHVKCFLGNWSRAMNLSRSCVSGLGLLPSHFLGRILAPFPNFLSKGRWNCHFLKHKAQRALSFYEKILRLNFLLGLWAPSDVSKSRPWHLFVPLCLLYLPKAIPVTSPFFHAFCKYTLIPTVCWDLFSIYVH